jgi:hypothetical protein
MGHNSGASVSTVSYADVYVDNSFPLSVDPTVEQNNYKYLGCFTGSALEYTDTWGTTASNVNNSAGYTSTAQCFYTCASLGFTLASFVSNSVTR